MTWTQETFELIVHNRSGSKPTGILLDHRAYQIVGVVHTTVATFNVNGHMGIPVYRYARNVKLLVLYRYGFGVLSGIYPCQSTDKTAVHRNAKAKTWYSVRTLDDVQSRQQ